MVNAEEDKKRRQRVEASKWAFNPRLVGNENMSNLMCMVIRFVVEILR